MTIGGQEYCLRGGFAFPGRCEVETNPTNPPAPVLFGPFGLPVSPEASTVLETGPIVGPSETPYRVPETPANPELSVAPPSWWSGVLRPFNRIANAVVPERFMGLRVFLGLAIPGGLLVLLALWILKKTRR